MSVKVHLIGGDAQGWALDVDLRMTRQALEGVVELVGSPAEADVVHSVNAENLVGDPRLAAKLIPGKTVVAQFTSLPTKLFEDFPSLYEACRGWVCVAQSTEAESSLRTLGVRDVRAVPYVAELESFFPVPAAELASLRKELRIPDGKYVIGSFVRDSLGADLRRFKPQKGADILLALLLGAAARVGKEKLHVLLAGPRRHWLRGKLEEHGISYSFDGRITEGDDNPANILPLSRVNQLINLIDLYVIPSRWEGAPAALFHVIAAKKKLISTDIAAPRDVLPREALFRTLSEGIAHIERDVRTNYLEAFVERNRELVLARHTPKALSEHWRRIYDEIGRGVKPEARASTAAAGVAHLGYSLKYKLLWKPRIAAARVKQKLFPSKGKSITIWGELVDGPYGGGSQALKAVAAELERRGIRVHNNSAHDSDGHIMNSAFFDQDLARSVLAGSRKAPRVVHRIDGPISLYRGKDRELDEAVFRLNRDVATSTAFQCHYSWEKSLELGFEGVRPMIIRNAVDPAFFHPPGRREPRAGRKLRIISSSWSTNQIKGFDVYQALDETLDFSRYEYRFVGRSPVKFRNIQMVEALPSKELGEQLRWADSYITASLHDPASNSLLEALACGLPALYRASGGHAEIAGYGGIPYVEAAEIPALLGQLEADYDRYLSVIQLRTVGEAVDRYLEALGL